MTTRTVSGSLRRQVEEGELLEPGDVFHRDGKWISTDDVGRVVCFNCPRVYWRRPEEIPSAVKNAITTETTYSLADPCCDALAADVSGGLFTIIDGLLSLEVGVQLMHIAFCPFCGTEINS